MSFAKPPASGSSSSGGGTADNQLRRRTNTPALTKFRNTARMVQTMNATSRRNLLVALTHGGQEDSSVRSTSGGGEGASGSHRSDVHPSDNVPYAGSSPMANEKSPFFEGPANRPRGASMELLDHAQHLENLFSMGPTANYEMVRSAAVTTTNRHHNHGYAPLPSVRESPSRNSSAPSVGRQSNASCDDESWRRPRTASADTFQYRSSDTSCALDVEQGNNSSNRPSGANGYVQDTTPLIHRNAADPPAGNNGSPTASPTMRRRQTARNASTLNRQTKPRCWTNFLAIVQPAEMWASIQHFFWTTVVLFMVPCLAGAWIFYYPLDNPDLEFLPSQARLSWFLLFVVRQSVTFTLAQLSQWVLLLLTTRTTLFVRMAGPLLALVAMQSQGWPFLVSAWGCWNMVLLHGDAPFVRHWFNFTGIGLFSITANPGGGILGSDIYGRGLAAMIVLGAAAAAKRTFVALYLSRRLLEYYRPQLELVMSQVKLIMEVAELADQTEQPGFDELLANATKEQIALERKNNKQYVEIVPTFKSSGKEKKKSVGANNSSEDRGMDSVDEDDDDIDDDDVDDDLGASGGAAEPSPEKGAAAVNDPLQEALDESDDETATKAQWNALKGRAVSDRHNMYFGGNEGNNHKAAKGHHRRDATSSVNSSRSGIQLLQPFLERWQEPEDKGRRTAAPTLHDILQFKKAIVFMEGSYPFSAAYGSAVTRKACVRNAVKVYRRLLKFTPDQQMLPFDVIGALAYKETGKLDDERAVALLRIFMPDKDDSYPCWPLSKLVMVSTKSYGSYAHRCPTLPRLIRF